MNRMGDGSAEHIIKAVKWRHPCTRKIDMSTFIYYI